MVSGFGHVSKECDEEVLGNWSDILLKWRKNYNERPRGLQTLVRRGEEILHFSFYTKFFFDLIQVFPKHYEEKYGNY